MLNKREYTRFTKTTSQHLVGYWAITVPLLFGYLRVKPARWATAGERRGERGRFGLGMHFTWKR